MKPTYLLLTLLLIGLSACSARKGPSAWVKADSTADTAATARTTSASGSIYDAGALPFVDQNGKTVQWNELKGKVRVMAMIFTHCQYACPRITKDMQNVEKLLPKNDPRIQYTLVSFDTQADSVQQMRKYYTRMGLDSNWLLLHGNEPDTRTVSALLDVKYKRMEDGLFSHESIIFVIDPAGRIALRREGLEGNPNEVADKVLAVLKS